jgi:hypothetical protein
MKKKKQAVSGEGAEEFNKLRESAVEFRKLMDNGEGVLKVFPLLLRDIFHALFVENPTLNPLDSLLCQTRLNRLVIDQLFKNREFRRIRAFTKGDKEGAGMAAMYFAGLVLGNLDKGIIETVNEIHTTEKELMRACVNMEIADKIIEVADSMEKPGISKKYRNYLAKWSGLAEEKNKQLRILSARLNLLWNTSGNKNTGVSGSDKLGERKGRFQTGTDGRGNNKGVWTTGDISSHLMKVDHYLNSPKIKRLAQKIGRLKEVPALKASRGLVEDAIEVMGIGFGNDLALVVPEEWADFFHPAKKNGFKKRFADEALCQYDVKTKKQKARGSMIICLDNSGSMQGAKEETSKAIAIALMEIAITQKRDFVVIMFGGPDDEMKVFEIPKGQCDFEQLIEIGEHFLCSSGTDFEKPLQEAVRFLEKDKYPGGDIVFLTDGACSVSPEFLYKYKEFKKARHFRTIAIMVNYGQVSITPVQAFCDELLMSKDLKGVDIAGELFGKLQGG